MPITDKSLTELADLLRQDQMADAFLGLSGTLSTGVFRTVNKVETVPVISDDPDKETAYVAIVGEPYPVRIETGTDVGSVDFLDYRPPGHDHGAAAVPGRRVRDTADELMSPVSGSGRSSDAGH